MSSPHPLAHAFLTLADDGAEPPRRSLAVAVAAALAAVIVSLGIPIGIPLGRLADHPVAVLGSKSQVALLDDG